LTVSHGTKLLVPKVAERLIGGVLRRRRPRAASPELRAGLTAVCRSVLELRQRLVAGCLHNFLRIVGERHDEIVELPRNHVP
jgi:hypothetical protein